MPKLAGNVQLAQEALTALGWRAEVIWECDARKLVELERRVLEDLKPKVVGHRSESRG